MSNIAVSHNGQAITVSFSLPSPLGPQTITFAAPGGQAISSGVDYSTTRGAAVSSGSQACRAVFEFVAPSSQPLTQLGVAFAVNCGSIAISGQVAYDLPVEVGQGYYLFTRASALVGFGNDSPLAYDGTPTGFHPTVPVVAMATTPTGGGYWLVASDGGIFSFTAPFCGSYGSSSSPTTGATGATGRSVAGMIRT